MHIEGKQLTFNIKVILKMIESYLGSLFSRTLEVFNHLQGEPSPLGSGLS